MKSIEKMMLMSKIRKDNLSHWSSNKNKADYYRKNQVMLLSKPSRLFLSRYLNLKIFRISVSLSFY